MESTIAQRSGIGNGQALKEPWWTVAPVSPERAIYKEGTFQSVHAADRTRAFRQMSINLGVICDDSQWLCRLAVFKIVFWWGSIQVTTRSPEMLGRAYGGFGQAKAGCAAPMFSGKLRYDWLGNGRSLSSERFKSFFKSFSQ